MSETVRLERSHVEFPRAVWTSFDRYSRYGAIARALRASLGPGRKQVLDVGDGAGYLSEFDDDVALVGVDVAPTPTPLPGVVRVAGDGSCLPFPDACFDAVVSSDALEHVPPDRRRPFVAELARVSSDLVVIAAPFDTPGVAGAEELARVFVLLATSAPQDQLEEHRQYGLPQLDATADALAGAGFEVLTAGNGNLHDWAMLMLLKHQISARPALDPLGNGYDVAYNLLWAGRQHVPPFYRHLVVGRRDGSPELGQGLGPIDGTPTDISGLLAGFLAANVAEAVKQDTFAELLNVVDQVAGARSLEELSASVDRRLTDMSAQVHAVDLKLEHVLTLLRHPLRSVSDKIRRKMGT